MELRYIKGDDISFKEYLKNSGHRFYFSNKRKWFVFSTLKAVIRVFALLVFILLLSLLFSDNIRYTFKIITTIFSGILFICLLYSWFITYYSSWIEPKIIKKRTHQFINSYLPDATGLTQAEIDSWHFVWRNTNYTIASKTDIARALTGYTVQLYYKIEIASSDVVPSVSNSIQKEEVVSKGIDIVFTDDNCFARINSSRKYTPNEITEALQILLQKNNEFRCS